MNKKMCEKCEKYLEIDRLQNEIHRNEIEINRSEIRMLHLKADNEKLYLSGFLDGIQSILNSISSNGIIHNSMRTRDVSLELNTILGNIKEKKK